MVFNDIGLQLLKSFESCKLTAYLDANGIPTIGWGTTGPDIVVGMTISQEEADKRLSDYLSTLVPAVIARINPAFNDNELSAAVCFAYNVKGWKTTPLFKFLQAGDRAAATYHWPLYVKDEDGVTLPGLVRRRQAELSLFLSV